MAIIPVARDDTLTYLEDFRYVVRPSLVGVILSSLLFGVQLHQHVIFGLQTGYKTNKLVTALVVAVALFSFIIFVTQLVYIFDMLVQDYGTPNLPKYNHSNAFATTLGFIPIIQALVQSFFAHRAWKLHQRNPTMGAALGICILGSFGAGIGMAVKNGTAFTDDTSQADMLKSMRDVTEAHYLSAACLDVVISALICVKLIQSKEDYRNTWMNTLLQRLLVLSMTTCSFTTVVAITAAIFAFISSEAGAGFVAVSMILPRCYAITLLFTLNIKDAINDGASRAANLPTPDVIEAQVPADRPHPLAQILEDQGLHIHLEKVKEEDPLATGTSSQGGGAAYPSSGIASF